MLVCMDVGVAAAYVVFVMRDMLFVSMDVGDAAWGHPSISQGEGVLSKRLKHTKYELPPLGRAWGGAASGTPAPWEGWGGALGLGEGL